MQSRSYLFLLLVLVLGGLSFWLYKAKAPKYGLDVSGGIRLTYELEEPKPQPGETPRNVGEDQGKVVSIMQNRVSGFGGTTEGNVAAKGTDEVVVELPGATNLEEAEKTMGTSAKLYFYHADNLSTDRDPNRLYRAVQGDDPNDPVVNFESNRTPGKLIKPGDPEYKKIITGATGTYDSPSPDGWSLILSGEELARAGSEPSGQGVKPTMEFTPKGADAMRAWSSKFYNMGENLAYVLDGKVLSVAPLAPNTRISNNAEINGTFTAQYVNNLKELLNAGSLPVELKLISSEKVDPTIGSQALSQIERAGAAAFGLVAIFLIAYYSFPGIVAAIALSLYVLFTLSVMKAIDATFSLAAIAGFILSVGMAVDANILVFERLKEEMKLGKDLHRAIHLGFKRALPAIIDSNACTILTSMVLAGFGTGAVKGFATTLIIGVLISLFTAVFVTRSLLVFFIDSGVASKPSWYAVERNWFKKYEAKADTEPMQIVERWKKWFWISGITIVLGIPFFFMGGFKLNVEFQGGYEAQYTVANHPQPNTFYTNNLEKNGLKGGNVKFASLEAPLLTLNFTQPDLITGTDKAATVAEALGNKEINPLKQNATAGAYSVTFDLKKFNMDKVDAAKALIDKSSFGQYTYSFDPKVPLTLVYITIPTAKALDGKSADQATAYIAQQAGLTDAVPSGFTSIGPTVQKEMIYNAIMAVIFSSILIIVYLSFRFGFSLGGFIPGMRFGSSAVLALVHDVLVVVGTAGIAGYLLGWEISALFVTALLTVIGFSVHDTIVVFDRIRENLGHPEKGHDLGFVMDRSITQTFARSVNTSVTVAATLAILIAFGTATPELKFFCLAMLVGIISGTYSSIYNASPILYLWDKAITKKDPKKGLVGLAQEELAKKRIISSGVRTATAPQTQSPETGRSYGQVRRRASSQSKGHVDLDDEP